jgi:hypothetical protein
MRIITIIAAITLYTATGCYISRDASTLVVQNGSTHSGTNNAAAGLAQTATASPHQSATTATHYILWTLAGVALCCIVAGIVWLVHNRGKLLGLAAQAATKV